MQLKIKKLLMIISIISFLVIGESLAANAMQSQIDDELTPDLFHVGEFNLHINVSKTAFTPETFTVKESAAVNLTIESIDIGHTFVIVEYGINEEIEANTTIVVEFIANKLGEFTFSSVNCSETGTFTVDDPYVPGLPRHDEVKILFDLRHNIDNNAIKSKYSGLVNWTQDNGFDFSFNEDIHVINQTLAGIDLLIILEPDDSTKNFTIFEIEAITQFVRDGGGLLIAGSADSISTNVNELIQPFGIRFDNATAMCINSTDLSDPIGENNTLSTFFISEFMDHPILTENQYVPLTDEIVSTINYVGSMLEINETWIEESLESYDLQVAGEIVDSYILASGNETTFADENGNGVVDENETIGLNNTLIVLTETKNNGRIATIGSANIFNDTQMGRNPENDLFYQRTIQWLTKMYAVIQNANFDLSIYTANQGDIINSNVSYLAQNNTLLEGINVTLRILRNSNIELEIDMETADNANYSVTIDTKKIGKGTVYINIVGHKRGYGYNTTTDIYLEVFPPGPEPLDVPIPYIITFALTIIVGLVALTFFFIRVIKTPKVAPSEKPEESEEELDEEEKDEVDLDEYETE